MTLQWLQEKINEFFINVASDITKLDLATLPSFLPASAPIPLVQPWEVYNELRYTNRRKAPGPDGISRKKSSQNLLTNWAFQWPTSLMPRLTKSRRRKDGNEQSLSPIPKKPKPSIEDLRPVSLTDHFSKITEKFISRFAYERHQKLNWPVPVWKQKRTRDGALSDWCFERYSS